MPPLFEGGQAGSDDHGALGNWAVGDGAPGHLAGRHARGFVGLMRAAALVGCGDPMGGKLGAVMPPGGGAGTAAGGTAVDEARLNAELNVEAAGSKFVPLDHAKAVRPLCAEAELVMPNSTARCTGRTWRPQTPSWDCQNTCR